MTLPDPLAPEEPNPPAPFPKKEGGAGNLIPPRKLGTLSTGAPEGPSEGRDRRRTNVKAAGLGSSGARGETVLAIDPGRAKCGVAVVAGPADPRCLERAVVETERLTLAVAEILRRRADVARLLLGGGTHSATLRRALAGAFPQIPLQVVDEYGTSARARQRFLQEHPPRGWRRLLPSGLRSPEIPYDDYAALLLAEDYFLK